MRNDMFLKGRSLLRLDDLSDEEMIYLIDLAEDFKRKKKMGIRGNSLRRKNIALIFEKLSTRTRCAFTVAARDEGGQSEYLGTQDIHFGKKESIKDTARVLGRMFDGIAFRGFKQATVEQLAKHSGIPVWNGLTDEWHPTQILADLLTIREYFGRLKGLKVVYIGDGRNNVANTLMIGCAKAGIHFVDCAPSELAPPIDLCREVALMAAKRGGSVTVTTNPMEAVKGANVVYSDVWVSMGEEDKFAERLKLLRPYQITMDLMGQTGNLDAGQAIFLHCLPAFHDYETEVTKEIGPMEVTDEVFEAPFSKVFDEAENRVHTIKAVMVASLA